MMLAKVFELDCGIGFEVGNRVRCLGCSKDGLIHFDDVSID